MRIRNAIVQSRIESLRKTNGMRNPNTLKNSLFIAAVAIWLAACVSTFVPHERVKTPALDPTKFSAIDVAIEAFIVAEKMPGAVFHLERGGQQYARAYGRYAYAVDAEIVETSSIYDIASLTKVVATAPAAMLMIEDGKLELDAPLSRYFPNCTGGGKDAITLRHLLTHTSGLAAGLPSRLANGDAWQGQQAAFTLACAQKVTHPPGTFFRYSDINFILLGLLVQQVGGEPLDTLIARRLFAPLQMRDTGFLPLSRAALSQSGVAISRIVPTQKSSLAPASSLHADLHEGQELRGIVHDPTIRFMGGVGGSAGVFSTAADLARFARMMLNEGELDGVRVLSRESVRLMTSVQSPATVAVRRSAGWDINSPFSRPRGELFPIGSVGHTGFTGCILWIDPFSKSFYVFLSNRVYPDDKSNILPLYGKLGTLAAEAIADFDFRNLPGALPKQTP